MSKRRKQQAQVEDIPVDKMDQFLAANYKKLLSAIAVLLVLFIAGYAFKTISGSKNALKMSKVGQLEMMMAISGGSEEHVDNFLASADEYPKAGDYITLKAAETLVKTGASAEAPLAQAGGELKELADGLSFDTGNIGIDTAKYMAEGKMSALWHYRAWLAGDDAVKAQVLESFREKHPDSELLKQVERWNS